MLTPQQIKVAEHVARGMTNHEVAFELNLKEKTIKFHLTNIFKALGVKDRKQLIIVFPQRRMELYSQCNVEMDIRTMIPPQFTT